MDFVAEAESLRNTGVSLNFGFSCLPLEVIKVRKEGDCVSFHQHHASDKGRVRYKKVCEVCGEEVAGEAIVKGFMDKVFFSDSELGELERERGVRVLGFTDKTVFDVPIEFVKDVFCLIPKKSVKGFSQAEVRAYSLFVELLKRKRAVAKFNYSGKEFNALLFEKEGLIMAYTLFFNGEVVNVGLNAKVLALKQMLSRLALQETDLKAVDASIAVAGEPDSTDLSNKTLDSFMELLERKKQGAEVAAVALKAEESDFSVQLLANVANLCKKKEVVT